jgi:hypothetical protein
MRVFGQASRAAVQKVIDNNRALLEGIVGFIDVEPGFPIIDGVIRKEPAILVFVAHKKPESELLVEDRAPRQIGAYRVAIMQAGPERQLAKMAGPVSDALARAAASRLTYKPLEGNPIDQQTYSISKPLLCHVGPDAGWPVLKPFLEATEHTLHVAMYDFNADYISKTFIETVRDKDLKVVLTWDDTMTAPEKTIRSQLREKLGEKLSGWIVRCGANKRFLNAYHEKVAVRDSKAFWLSSGNWSTKSQPDIDPIANPASASGMYSKGNREWHVIVEDAPLAKLFQRYIEYDRDGSKAEAEAGDHGAVLRSAESPRLPDLFVPVDNFAAPIEFAAPPQPTAPARLPTSPRAVKVRPLLTPDNYVGHIIDLLGSAERSVYLQYAYITYSEEPSDERFTQMLTRLAELSNRAHMDVRIIVGSGDAADKIRKLVQHGFRETAFRVQSNIHNKGIVVDGNKVLVSSANWSGDGVLRNRDAGLLIYDEEIAGYYQNVFIKDWENRAKARLDDDPPVRIAADGEPTPPGMVRMSWQDYYG